VTKQGTVLGDRYELGPRLGTGGMATVYRARDRVLGRDVAVKVLAHGYASDTSFVERFRREARAAAGLNHPNVVTVYDHGADDGSRYIVMEHVDGRTLAEVLAQEGTLAPERAAAITAGVARALDAAHRRDLVHRDVKPANILLTRDDRAKVADFGIARAAADAALTATGTVIGTATYIAPEQAAGRSVDHRSDIYSLGCVLYEMLAGRPPFTADTDLALASRHVRDDPAPPSSIRDGIPPELERVVMTALAKDPGRRFRTAREMADAAAAAMIPPGAATAVIEPGQRTAVMPAIPDEPGRDRRWLPWLLAAGGAGLLGLMLLLLSLRPSERLVSPPNQVNRGVETPSPAPRENPVLSFAEAYGAFLAVMDHALEIGDVSPATARDVTRRMDDAVRAYQEGEAEDALEALDEARGELAGHAARGDVDPEAAAAIGAAIDAMEAAVLRDAPQPVDDEGDDGTPGKSKGNDKGKGKGNDSD
jgi:serine/threonine protein kinase